ncbi:MAG: right-handed parallel beta-helix repeat-containing protein [Mucilaginibacter sp.]
MENENYRVSQPISLFGVHDMTICGYSINGGASSCIDLVNCSNIHITQCELVNSDQLGVNLTECTNILIDNCYVANVSSGIHSLNGVNIQVRNNTIKKLGPNSILVRFESTGIDVAKATSYCTNNQLA